MPIPSELTPQESATTSSEPLALSDALKKAIDHWLAKYPSDRRQSALIPALLTAQRHHKGWLPRPLIDAVAEYIGIAKTAAYEVATFYSMLELSPVGQYKISLCTNVSCMLNGSDKIAKHVKKRLKVQFNETTSNQKITLKEVECLGACTKAPVMLVDEVYHENITLESVNAVLDAIEKE